MSHPIVHFEVMSKDQAKAKAFYTSVFGWETEDWPMPDGLYLGVKAKDGGVGGGIGAMPGPAPAMATCYVEVADPQASLDSAVANGATLMQPVTDLGMVVIAMFADPEGHPIGLVKSDPTQGAHEHEHVAATEGAVEWFEVIGKDGAKLRDFYQKVFGWEIQVMPGDMDYGMADTKAGGIGAGIGTGPNGQSYQAFYIHTADITAKLKQIEAPAARPSCRRLTWA